MPINGADGYASMRGDGLLGFQYGNYPPHHNFNNNNNLSNNNNHNNNLNNHHLATSNGGRSDGFGSRPCLRCGARENVVCEVCFAPYCNAECQKLDWSYGHVIHCKPIPGSLPSLTLLNTLPSSTPSRVPNVGDVPIYGSGNASTHRQQPVFSRSSSRSDSGERSWIGGPKPPSRAPGEKSHLLWSANAGLEIKKAYSKGDSDSFSTITTTSTLNGAAPAWKPRGKQFLQGNFMGIPDDVWNNTIRSVWPATESTMKINVLAMGNQCGGYYDFAGVIDGTPETFLALQQLEVDAAAYCEKVKEAYIPAPGDMVLAKYDGMFYRAVAINHKRVWFMDFGNFAEVSPLDVRRMAPELMEVMPVINLFKLHGIKPAVGEVFDEQSRHDLISSWEMMTQIDAVCKGLDENGRVIRVEVPALYKQLSDAGVIRIC